MTLRLARRDRSRDWEGREEDLHRAVADFAALACPKGGEVAFTTFPAGGGGKVRGAILKAMGLRAGWPDTQLMWRGRAFFVELKTKDGVLSQAQKDCIADLARAGCPCGVARSAEQWEEIVRGFGVPLKATLRLLPIPAAGYG